MPLLDTPWASAHAGPYSGPCMAMPQASRMWQPRSGATRASTFGCTGPCPWLARCITSQADLANLCGRASCAHCAPSQMCGAQVQPWCSHVWGSHVWGSHVWGTGAAMVCVLGSASGWLERQAPGGAHAPRLTLQPEASCAADARTCTEGYISLHMRISLSLLCSPQHRESIISVALLHPLSIGSCTGQGRLGIFSFPAHASIGCISCGGLASYLALCTLLLFRYSLCFCVPPTRPRIASPPLEVHILPLLLSLPSARPTLSEDSHPV